MSQATTHEFRAETQKVLNILTHSLYTNREIFLRELLSNAADALDKLRFLQSKGGSVRDAELPLEIRVSIDKIEGMLRISDTGIGMTEQELIDNLGTIAKSGSEQFVRENEAGGSEAGSKDEAAAKTSAPQIIGHFGIGFYSVFMAADSVEVISVPATGDEGAHVWKSEGVGSFSVRALDADEAASFKRGTVIRVKLKEDAKEFLEKYRLQSVIRGHSNFLPFPIILEDERINTTPALWREPKFSITPEQYADFYKYLTYDDKPPLDVIHLSVDAPVQFSALIFIPDSAQEFFGEQRDQWGLDLYVRRVLIERANRELVPNYLAFLKGVVDTEDLPLNISRETLQENVVLRKISQTILKQILNHLENMARSDKEKYEKFWKLHGKYCKFAFNDYVNRDRIATLMRFTSSAQENTDRDKTALTSLDEYLDRAKPGQKEIWHVAAPSLEAAKVNPHLERFRRKGVEVLYLLEAVDEFALENLGTYKDHAFKSVEQADAKSLDEFPDLEKAEEPAAALDAGEKESFDKLVGHMKTILGEQVKDIRVSDRLTGNPAVLVSPDGVSSSMEKLMRVMQKSDDIPPKILEVNPAHPLLRNLLRVYRHDPENPLLAELTHNLFDSVLLLDGYIKDPSLIADRTLKLMDKAAAWYTDLLKI
jgi:molecular chaperone HtpG